MNKVSTFRARLLSGLLFLIALCTGLSALGSWLPLGKTATSLFGWLLCCNFQQNAATSMSSGAYLLATVLVLGLMAMGVGTLLWHGFRTYSQVGRLVRIVPVQTPPAKLVPLLTGLNLGGRVLVVHSSEVFAFCFGFLQPRICLSTGLVAILTPDQLKAVLLHEDYHRRRYDPLRLLLVEILGKVLFFLPIVREWAEMVEVNLEISADQYAISIAGKPALAGALYRMMAATTGNLSSGAGVVIAGLSANATRVGVLLGEREILIRFSESGLAQSALSLGVLCLWLMS